MKTRHFALAALALVVSLPVTVHAATWGQIKAQGANPVHSSLSQSRTTAPTTMAGEFAFNMCQKNALATLSLADMGALTPYVTGSLSIEKATLAEITRITPAVMHFRQAFSDEVSRLSIGQVVQLAGYMNGAGVSSFLYPSVNA